MAIRPTDSSISYLHILIFSLVCVTKYTDGDFNRTTLTFGCSLPWDKGWPVGGEIASAVIIAIEEIHRRQLLPGYEIEWIWRDSYCEPRHGMAMAVDMWTSVDLDAIIGDGCSVVCQPVSLLAASWNIPAISWGCISNALSNKANYPTFTRTDGPVSMLGPVYDKLADTFGWQTVGIMTSDDVIWQLAGESVKTELETHGKTVVFRIIASTVQGETLVESRMRDLQETMASLKDLVRVLFIFSYIPDLKNMLVVARNENMLNGKYVFVTHENHNFLINEYPYQTREQTFMTDGLIGVTLKGQSGQEFEDFLQRVIDEFQGSRFDGVPHVPADASIENINSYAGTKPNSH